MTESKDHTEVFFPVKKVTFGEGDQDFVEMCPLPMSEIADAIDVFAGILENLYANGGEDSDFTPAMMATAGKGVAKGILGLLPKCTDKNLSDIPAHAMPELIRVFIHQNVLSAAKNWYALFDTVGLSKMFRNVSSTLDSIGTSGGQS